MHTIYCSLCSFSYKELKSHGKCNEKMFPGKLYKEIYIHINVESVGKGQHFGIVSVLVYICSPSSNDHLKLRLGL